MFPSTPQLDYNAVVGVHVKKICVITDCLMYTRPLFKLIKIVNEASSPGFHIRKQMPHQPSFGVGHQSVVVSFIVMTHLLFINRSINRCVL